MTIRAGVGVFVDTGAWIALALIQDPHHERAREIWEGLLASGARITTSVSVVLETFTFLDRNARRDVAVAWKDALPDVPHFRLLECSKKDLALAWAYFDRTNFHKLSAVDATSFVIMRREKLRLAFAFDHHFATAGFRLVD
jgi:predicted nucleic acid-binding protein